MAGALRRISVDDPVIMKILTVKREKAALDFAVQATKTSDKKNQLVFIVYGGTHNFAKRFKEAMNNPHVHYIGRVNTLDTRINALPDTSEPIYPAGVPIDDKNTFCISKIKFKEIINSYNVKYRSTSMFGSFSFYQSSAIRSLNNLSDTIKTEAISINDIYAALKKSDEHVATLFLTGQDSDTPMSLTATRQIIMELRNSITQPATVVNDIAVGEKHQC